MKAAEPTPAPEPQQLADGFTLDLDLSSFDIDFDIDLSGLVGDIDTNFDLEIKSTPHQYGAKKII